MSAKPVLLCIDDEPTALMVRRLVLESAGYQVLTATSGWEGLQIVGGEEIDMVVVDYVMPGLDGAETARHIRQIKPQIPLLLLSAYVSFPQEVLSLFDAYVTKGEAPSTLLEQIAALVHQDHDSCLIPESCEETKWFAGAD